MVVEHVHVHPGAQAIVGAVQPRGRGEGGMKDRCEAKPHARRRDRLRNDNPVSDFLQDPRCGARTRAGTPCRAPAMWNGKCRLHGGCSTGPRTAAGLQRLREAKTRHGLYAKEALNFRRRVNQILREAKAHVRDFALTED